MTTPKEIKSRFHSNRENTARLSLKHSNVKDRQRGENAYVSDIVDALPTVSKSAKTSLSEMRATEYTISFQPGTIGLKLEPVIKNNEGKEFGCRVMDFVDLPEPLKISQARASGKIKIGDIFASVDGRNVISKPYSDIVTILTQSPKEKSRKITFRVPKSPPILSKYDGTQIDVIGDPRAYSSRTSDDDISPTDMTFFSPSYVKMTPLLKDETRRENDLEYTTERSLNNKEPKDSLDVQFLRSSSYNYEEVGPSSVKDDTMVSKSVLIEELKDSFENKPTKNKLEFVSKQPFYLDTII